MKELKKLNVEIIGEEEQLSQLAYFLKLVEYLGNVGATRTLKLWIDGDGTIRFKVNFPVYRLYYFLERQSSFHSNAGKLHCRHFLENTVQILWSLHIALSPTDWG